MQNLKIFFKYMGHDFKIMVNPLHIKFSKSSKCVTDHWKIDLKSWNICKENILF